MIWLGSCPKCIIGSLFGATELGVRIVSCINCGNEVQPPLCPDILNEDGSLKRLSKGGNPPKTGKDVYSWEEKTGRRKQNIRPYLGL